MKNRSTMAMIGTKAYFAAWWAVALCYTSYADASTSFRQEPHPHRGVATPFESTLPNIKLDASAENVLSVGKPYQTLVPQQVSASSSIGDGQGKNHDNVVMRTMLVQDVKAPVKTVMDRILDYNHYSRMAPHTLESEIYHREQQKVETSSSSSAAAAERLWVRLKAGAPGMTIQFFCNVLHEPAKNMVTWTLDYNKKSDVYDSVGYWYVEPHPANPTQWARVHYSTELSLFSWVPKFVGDIISKSALVSGWLVC
jgi:Polyketide cyclase / dehydrase and lipid transport